MRKLSRWIPVVGGAALAGGIIALVLATNLHTTTRSVTTTVVQQGTSTTEPTAFASSGGAGMSINQIYHAAAPGVVDIKVISQGSGSSSLFGGGSGSGKEEGEGAGVVYDDQGDIITDEHVIKGAIKTTVTFEDGKTVPAKVLGSDSSTDVGVIKVDVPTSELHPIKFADSDTAQVGDPVLAIGSPFSQPETATSGIVSYAGRVITAPNNFSIPGAIQTDAAINPGNSGGPLLNADGQVLGLNDQIETDTTNSATGEGQNSGIGFATPSNADVKVAGEIIAGQTVKHAYLGASLEPSDSAPGAEVGCVQSDTPASTAGLEVNDLITKVGSTAVSSPDQLISVLSTDYEPGQAVTLTIQRAGATKQIKVTLGNRPAEAPSCG